MDGIHRHDTAPTKEARSPGVEFGGAVDTWKERLGWLRKALDLGRKLYTKGNSPALCMGTSLPQDGGDGLDSLILLKFDISEEQKWMGEGELRQKALGGHQMAGTDPSEKGPSWVIHLVLWSEPEQPPDHPLQ